ncbi:MAG: AAA family ATPase [Bacteroidetes bacterium]|nr:AAA family ATPase [Bacteroidota bacterium]MCA6445396.1 AAA family ATPase [Bacteroidota bacterium]
MEFIINNCNNIDSGTIQITKSKLNIKFGINGTGKSTIAKAVKYSIESPEKLKELTPFKLQKAESEQKPEVTKPAEIASVFIFNEEYLNQFLYKKDELISNSFEIFIKTPSYIQSLEKIEEILTGIKQVFSENKELEQIINDFESLSKSFTTTQTGLSKTSSVYKGLKDGNLLEHIPPHLKGYTSFIKNKSCTSWLDWQMKGAEFVDISDDCPYCTSPTAEKKETIKSISKTYDKNVIKNFSIIIDAIQNLGNYFSDDAKNTLETITKKQTGLEDSEIDYIVTIKQQIDNLLGKLKLLKEISPKSFKDDEKAEEKLKSLIINIDLFDRFKSNQTTEIITSLNNSLNTVLAKIGLLQGEINKQKQQTKKIIEEHQESINTFLKNAGYKYLVEIAENNEEDYKLKLRHVDSDEKISGGNQHLSFGEKNAFALVLFMYEALAKNPDLIILDDPISSFDKNKKYALMHMLFRGDKCLKNKTVLLLTHDLDPIIDTIKVLKEFGNLTDAKFLLTDNGVLNEKDIKKENLLTFSQICKKVIDSNTDEIIKLIYLRRNYELLGALGDEYQVLSNLFHKRKKDECKDFRKEPGNDLMTENDFENGITEIKKILPDFDYESCLQKLSNKGQIKTLYQATDNGYEKLHLFRILFEDSLDEIGSVLRKFINESYHIENEQICQLDPSEFDLIPSFVINECTSYIVN